jgi:hypothetical protein
MQALGLSERLGMQHDPNKQNDPKQYQEVRTYIIRRCEAERAVTLPAFKNGEEARRTLKRLVDDPGHQAKLQTLKDFDEAPRTWAADKVACLGTIAACRSEDVRIRNCALHLIGVCRLAQFDDLLATILADWEKDIECASSAATSLGSLESRKHLPLLADVARQIGSNVKRYSYPYFVHRECVTAIYLALFDYHGRGPGTFRNDAVAWWERVHPTRLDVEGWLQGLNVPEDDGLGHPRRPGWE